MANNLLESNRRAAVAVVIVDESDFVCSSRCSFSFHFSRAFVINLLIDSRGSVSLNNACALFHLKFIAHHPPCAPKWPSKRSQHRFWQVIFICSSARSLSCVKYANFAVRLGCPSAARGGLHCLRSPPGCTAIKT